MSEMHYIAKFAEKQLADAKEKGMCSECLAALLNALSAEADALTPGGSFVVAHVAKELDLLEELPGEKEPDYASVDALARDLSREQRPPHTRADAAQELPAQQAEKKVEPALPPINVYQINGRDGCAVIVSAPGKFWQEAGKERQEMLLMAVHKRTGNHVLSVVSDDCEVIDPRYHQLDGVLTTMSAVGNRASLDAAIRGQYRAEGVLSLVREILREEGVDPSKDIDSQAYPAWVEKVRCAGERLLTGQERAQ